jgi:peptide/nickel transport system substrate-binding protein
VRKRLIGFLIVAALSGGACGSATSTANSPAALSPPAVSAPTVALTPIASATSVPVALTGSTYRATTAAATGGTVTLAEWQFPDTVNPYYARGETDIEASDSMFDGLLTVTPDLRYAPDLATNVPTIQNGGVVPTGGGMDVTWTLRAGMMWSDGRPINCDDILATWKWVMDPANSGLAGGTVGWGDVTGVDGGAGTNCVMHFGKVYEGYLNLVSPLLPAHYITTVPVKDAPTGLYPLGNLASGVYSGPYIPRTVVADTQITMVPNPNWQTISGHAPYLASVIWKYYGGTDTEIAGYKAGEFDVGNDFNNATPSLASINPAQVVAHDSLTYELDAFNNASFTARFGADGATIINAIKLATDRQAIANGPLAGNVTVTNNFVSPLSWYYRDVGGSTAADPTTAKTLLANAGWVAGPDGYLTKGGKTIELNYCTTLSQVREDTLKLIAGQLKAIGIKVDVTVRPSSDVFGGWNDTPASTPCNLQHGNFDVAEFSYVSPVDPLVGYSVYYSSETPDNAPHTGGNISRIDLPALDAAYDAVRSSADFVKVRAAMYSIQEIYGSDRNTYELPLYFSRDVWLVNPRLHNFTGNPTPSGGEWNIGDWWVG